MLHTGRTAQRSSVGRTTAGAAAVTILLALSVVTSGCGFALDVGAGEGGASAFNDALARKNNPNLCLGQPADVFHCLDDTRFEECAGDGTFVVSGCQPGLCATRHPASRNACVGVDRATELDGVAPTPPGQINDDPVDGGPGDDDSASAEDPPANAPPGASNGTCDVNLCAGEPANTFHCLDDTRFQHCTGGDAFVVDACPAGLCATRHPAEGNPCVGADRAEVADGVPPTPACQ